MSELDIQASWVSVLLDVGEERVFWDEYARDNGSRWYGEGKEDDLQNGERYASALTSVLQQHLNSPNSWSREMSWLANSCIFATDVKHLRTNLIRLTAMAVAWVEDIDRREVPGYKK